MSKIYLACLQFAFFSRWPFIPLGGRLRIWFNQIDFSDYDSFVVLFIAA